jgi:hypothetical protein
MTAKHNKLATLTLCDMHVVTHYFPSGYIRVSNVYRTLKMLTPDIDPIPPEVLAEFNLANLFDVRINTTNFTSHNRVTFIGLSFVLIYNCIDIHYMFGHARHAFYDL